jgi:hypothetical protein
LLLYSSYLPLGVPNWPIIYFINYMPTSSLTPFITAPSIAINHHEGDGGGGHDDDHHEGDVAGADGGGEDVASTGTQTRLTSALQDPHVQELLLTEMSNVKAAAREKAKLEHMDIDGKTLLFPGCRPKDTRLSIMLKALKMKAESKWTDVSFNKNMRFWQKCLPKGNTCPTNIEEAKKIVCPLDLPYVMYHTCINDCTLYRDEYAERTTCLVCGQGRYKIGNKKVPRKVVWYFPITPRLQRYFVDPKEAKLMRWHADRKKTKDDLHKGKILTHPSDASQWNALDIDFHEFGADPRNIRLGMSTNGLNPFGNQSSTHSTWPMFVWPYNLPPWLCTK